MLSKLKAENELESKLSSSPELESSELESSTMVECPVLGDLLRRKCLEYQLYIRSGEAVDDALVEEIVRQSLGDPSQTM